MEGRVLTKYMNNIKGFSLVELLAVIAVIAILSAIAVPGIIDIIPDYKLKSAVQELYGNMQKAKMRAIHINSNVGVVFTEDIYFIDENNDKTLDANETWVDITGYGSGVQFDGTVKNIIFRSMGTSTNRTNIIKNNKNTRWKIVTSTAGRIRTEKLYN